MTVSVIIPTFNSESTIERALESCYQQTPLPLEILVIDNNSTDSTVKRVQQLEGRVPVRVLSEPRQGSNYCRNKGLAEASGDLIQFLDSDDELLPGKLKHQSGLFENSAVAQVCGGYIRVAESNQKEIRLVNDLSIPLLLFRGNLGKTSSMMFRRKPLLEINGWSDLQQSSQEYELTFRLLQNKFKLHVTDEIQTKVHEIGDQRISVKNREDNALRFLKLREQMLAYFTTADVLKSKEKQLWAQSLYNAITDLADFDKESAEVAIKRHKNGLLRSLSYKSKLHAFIKFTVPIAL